MVIGTANRSLFLDLRPIVGRAQVINAPLGGHCQAIARRTIKSFFCIFRFFFRHNSPSLLWLMKLVFCPPPKKEKVQCVYENNIIIYVKLLHPVAKNNPRGCAIIAHNNQIVWIIDDLIFTIWAYHNPPPILRLTIPIILFYNNSHGTMITALDFI